MIPHVPARPFRQRWLPRLLALAIGGACAASAPAQSGPAAPLDRIVAIVNDDVIASSELDARLDTVREQLRGSGASLPPPDVLRRQVLDRLVIERLQLQRARDSGIRIDDETLNRAMQRLAEQNALTLRQFRDVLEREGYGFATFREEIRDDLMISEVRRREVESQVRISQRDIDHYLSTAGNREAAERDQYRIGHILIGVPGEASPEEVAEARSRAERVLGEIRGGADFTSMAVAHSDGQQALEGGDLGWRKAADLPTIFVDAVLRLAVGEVTDPIRSPSGFHLVKLVDKRGGERQIVEQTRARHILVVLDELTNETEAIRQLQALRERIVNGEVFGELARLHSDDPGSAPKGGELGWINPGSTVPEFERVMNSLAPGGISEPFESQFGWHLVQVLERREHDDTEAARRAEALRRLRARRIEEEMQTWIRQVRAEAYVEYRLEE